MRYVRRYFFRALARILERNGFKVIGADLLTRITAESESLHEFTHKSGYLRNLKTGRGFHAERKVRSSAGVILSGCAMAIAGHEVIAGRRLDA